MHRLFAALIALFATTTLFVVPSARAGHEAAHASTVELVDGGWWKGKRLAAVVMRLAPGWKTYWRVPGEGGLPPRFDFSGSENVKEVRVLWPAPKRYSSPLTGETIGYKHEVVFPLLVLPENPKKPVTLRLKMDYGVCGEMCMPARATVAITLPPTTQSAPARATIEQWLRKTPLSDDGRVKVASARLVKTADGMALEVALAGPDAGKVSDIFVEGVDMAIFGRPEMVGERNGEVIYRIPVRGLAEEKDFRAAKLRFTILRGEKAVVRSASLS